MSKRFRFILIFIIIILTSCTTKTVEFSDYMGDLEQNVIKFVKDQQRAEAVVIVLREIDAYFIGIKPVYQELMYKKKALDYAYNHDAEGYRLLYLEIDSLNDDIRDELLEYSKEIRSNLEEKEWRKLTDPAFYHTFLFHLEQEL